MTTMLHASRRDPMDAQLSCLSCATSSASRAAATTLAENYVGYPPLPSEFF